MRRIRNWVMPAALALALSAPSIYAKATKKRAHPKAAPVIAQISPDEQALHVLSRLTFGARPGDLEEVKRIGPEAYIQRQLHPETIPENPALEAKLAPLETLRLSSAELVAKYPPPQAIRAIAEGREPMPTDPAILAMIRRPLERYKEKANQAAADPNAPAVSLEEVSFKLTPDQRQTMRTGTPEQKIAALESMPLDEQYDLLEAIGGKRQALMFAASPELARRVEKMNGPQFVVNQDLFSAKLLRAAYSNRQLEEVLTDFWYNHFNVYIDKGADRYLVTSYERDVIRPNVLGHFKDLLLATAKSPAMLFYLDNAESVGPDAPANKTAKKRRGLNENYGRELMELHTLGVDGGYTQQDVTDVARCFTGWTIRAPNGPGGRAGRDAGEFFFNERLHDKGAKTVLGVNIPAGGGMDDGLKVLDILEHSPATARFISKSLAIRFVSDNPSPALIDAMAKTFTATDGDLRAVMAAMFHSPDFFARDNYRAKVKTPLEMVVSAVRASNAEFQFPLSLTQQLNQLGEPLYRKQEPTGYSNKNGDWVNSAALLARMNFSLALTSNKVPGVKVDLTNLPAGDPMAAGLAFGSPDFQRR